LHNVGREGQNMIGVFVSSTFVDLIEHRSAVRDCLQQAGFRDVAMETMGAVDARPQAHCLKLIEEQCSYFLGIYAHRYGHVPSGASMSITEAEYHAAGKAGLTRLIYLVDRQMPWLPDFIDKGESAVRLLRLKEQISEQLVCKTFTTPDNLAKNVAADLGREVRNAQLKTIDAADAESTPAKPWTAERDARYQERRFLHLVHVIEPSRDPRQKYDVVIYLFRHEKRNGGSPFGLDDVVSADFYLGSGWGNRVFTCKNDGSGGFVGIKVAAYGTFLCMCRVTFKDGATVLLDRYVDFEDHRMEDAFLPSAPTAAAA
jgi:hypothetical protein